MFRRKYIIFALLLYMSICNAFASIITVTYDFKITGTGFWDYNTSNSTYSNTVRHATISTSFDSQLNSYSNSNKSITNHNVRWVTSLDSELIEEFSPNLSSGDQSSTYIHAKGVIFGGYRFKDDIGSIQRLTSWNSSFAPPANSIVNVSRQERSIDISNYNPATNPTNNFTFVKPIVDLSTDLKTNYINNMNIGALFQVQIDSADYISYKFPNNSTMKYSGFSNTWSGTATIKSVTDSADIASVPLPSSIWLFTASICFSGLYCRKIDG